MASSNTWRVELACFSVLLVLVAVQGMLSMWELPRRGNFGKAMSVKLSGRERNLALRGKNRFVIATLY